MASCSVRTPKRTSVGQPALHGDVRTLRIGINQQCASSLLRQSNRQVDSQCRRADPALGARDC
jgi:hypothetical protein